MSKENGERADAHTLDRKFGIRIRRGSHRVLETVPFDDTGALF
jgi:hypothetical protein